MYALPRKRERPLRAVLQNRSHRGENAARRGLAIFHPSHSTGPRPLCPKIMWSPWAGRAGRTLAAWTFDVGTFLLVSKLLNSRKAYRRPLSFTTGGVGCPVGISAAIRYV